MHIACKSKDSTMAAIIGLEASKIETICNKQDGVGVVANYNSPSQIVISGDTNTIEKTCIKLTEAGAKRTVILPVGGAFHSPIMKSAKKSLELAINSTEFNQYILVPGDEIYIPEELAVFVTGFVKNPGRYKYFIGFSVEDYLGLAGGNLTTGNLSNVQIQHVDNSISVGIYNLIKRGDIIYVPERNLSKLVGELSILQIISYLTSIVLTYIAATK